MCWISHAPTEQVRDLDNGCEGGKMSALNWILNGTLADTLPAVPSSENRPRQVLGSAYSQVAPLELQSTPSVLIRSPDVSGLLGVSDDTDMLGLLFGQSVPSVISPYAMCYGGHQFGHWVDQLGDGRAIVLGVVR